MNDIPLCVLGHPMDATSVVSSAAPKAFSCSGSCCANPRMRQVPHYYICKECNNALCPPCAIEQSQLYKLLILIDRIENKMVSSRAPFMKEGFLQKKGMGRLYRPWVRRHFILDDRFVLGYYKDDEMKGAVSLRGSSITVLRAREADGRNFAFSISDPEILQSGTSFFTAGELTLAASSMEEAAEWCACIQRAIKAAADFGSPDRNKIDFGDSISNSGSGKSDAGEEIVIVRKPSASGGIIATPQAEIAKTLDAKAPDAVEDVPQPTASQTSKTGTASALLSAVSNFTAGSKSQLLPPAVVSKEPPAEKPSTFSVGAALRRNDLTTGHDDEARSSRVSDVSPANVIRTDEASRQLLRLIFTGVQVKKKFSKESTFRLRFIWIDEKTKQFNWSKEMEKSEKHKSVNLVSIATCVVEIPQKIPLSSSRPALEGRCVRMIVDNQNGRPEDLAAFHGSSGIDLKFQTNDMAVKWVETVNTLISHAVASNHN